VLTLVGAKLTEREIDVLDWLVGRLGIPSRSEALRRSLLDAAKRAGLRTLVLAEIADERSRHPIRFRANRPARRPRSPAQPEYESGPA
jgi:hypothetical protein